MRTIYCTHAIMKITNGKEWRNRCILLFACCVVLILAGAGCAGIAYQPIQSDAQDASSATTGLRYFDSSPYLLMQKDKGGTNWTAQLLYLPDQTKKYQAQPYAWLAMNNSSFAFSNAILTDASSDADASAVAAAIIQTAAKIANTVGPFARVQGAPTLANLLTNSNVALFKIVRVKQDETNWVWGIIGGSGAK